MGPRDRASGHQPLYRGQNRLGRSQLRGWRELVSRRDYHGLKRLLKQGNLGPLRAEWKRLEPMEKAVLFKLMEPGVAMNFYRELSFSEKYFLLTAFDPGSIAPVLEDLPPSTSALFHRLPEQS